MPVHRHVHDKMGSVYASRVELDAWALGRNIRAADNGRTVLENESDVAPLVEPIPPKRAASASRTLWTRVFSLALMAAALVIGTGLWLRGKEYFWRNPIADARFQTITDVDAVAQAATVSRDGHFVAFLSDRDGQMDVWLTQVGSGQFHNLTRGGAPELVNPSVRTLGFRPMGPWLRFGFARRTNQAAPTSASGRYQRSVEESRSPTLKEWPSSIGRTTAPNSRTTHLDPETRCSYQR